MSVSHKSIGENASVERIPAPPCLPHEKGRTTASAKRPRRSVAFGLSAAESREPHRLEVLLEERRQLIERNQIDSIVKVDVTCTRYDDKLFR